MSENTDVVIFGLTVPRCVLHDIQMDVAHGDVLSIPADKAYRSKDLWRAIGQRQVFRLMNGPGQVSLPVPVPAPVTPPPPEPSNNGGQALEEENRALKEALSAQSQKLDSILSLLQSGIPMATIQASVFSNSQKVGVVADETPIFIPSTIKPENAETRIESKKSESAASQVSGAAEKLRRLRQKP